jgi:hypothetical protein
MSAFGGKADMLFAVRMSPFDQSGHVKAADQQVVNAPAQW